MAYYLHGGVRKTPSGYLLRLNQTYRPQNGDDDAVAFFPDEQPLLPNRPG